MSDQFWLTEAQIKRIEPHFPLSHGVPRVDDRRVVSGIIHEIRNGLRPRSTGRTRPCTTGSSAGPAWACSTASLPTWPPKRGRPTG